ncbi:MAG: molecular chaperone DnaJ [Bdellovibrionaceae bacterium]|nr:molecular chaperone DnaJ [Pseudobdellovibrionaceae bacterium]
MSTNRDYYEILGVAKDADADSIKKSYRKLAMQFHPDRNPNNKEAEDKFKEAAEAYDVLSNPEKRAQYDRFGHSAFKQTGGRGFNQGFDNVEDIFSNFGDIFGDIFGMGGTGSSRSRRSRNEPRKGSDLRYLTEISLKEVITGVEREIEFETDESCKDCHGSGAEKGSHAETCSMCGGSGQVVTRQGFFTMQTTCPQCRGEGTIIKKPCRTCRGSGRTAKAKKIQVTIPAGVDTGTRLRISGEGEGGHKGGPAGDLFVEVRVKEQENYERHGNDLHTILKVPYVLLLLGGEIEVNTLTSSEKIEIPKASHPGVQVKLKEHGFPAVRSQRRGDMFFHLEAEYPKKISSEEEKHLKEIAKLYHLDTQDSKGGFFGRKK